MNSISELLQQIPDPNLSTAEQARLRCQLAKQFEKTGNHEAACGAMGNLWPGFGKHPNVAMLDERTSGEVLLRAGVLTGWIGSKRLIKGSQKIARDLISESIAIFESLPDVKKVAEAQTEIAFCCTREGALEMARALYAEALAWLDDQDGDLKAVAVLRSAMVELVASRLNDALSILSAAVALFAASTNPVLRGSFHNEFAKVLKNIGVGESRTDYIERALNEYAAAIFQFEQAGHALYQGVVENNLAMLFLELEQFAEAHAHLDRAQALFTRLDASGYRAALEDTRARVFLAEGEFAKAEKVALTAIRMLERGDEKALLSEALTTQGIALARLHRPDEAREVFERAIEVANQAGNLESAGLAALVWVEQLAERLSEDELCATLDLARNCLRNTQNEESRKRLTECAYRVLSLIHTSRPDWANFSLEESLHRHESRLIKMALEDSGGSVTKAAALLGLPGHQSLSFIINRRHQHLLKARTPIKPRRRSIVKNESKLSNEN